MLKPILRESFRKLMSALLKRNSFKAVIRERVKTESPKTTVYLEYPLDSKPRYINPHPRLNHIIDRNRGSFVDHLRSFLDYQDSLSRIPLNESNSSSAEPYWTNTYLPEIDSTSLYCFLARNNAERYFEIGSGNSTRFARRAINDHSLRTRITSIDPEPRSEIANISDRNIRTPLEDLDLSIFSELGPGDVLFLDCSHCIYMNSDATVFFMDILPSLRTGVTVGVHDIFLPFDYPAEWVNRYYSEQYVLAAYLLAEGGRFETLLANSFVSHDRELRAILSPMWQRVGLNGSLRTGSAFWLRIT